jgi:hypothetical protein
VIGNVQKTRRLVSRDVTRPGVLQMLRAVDRYAYIGCGSTAYCSIPPGIASDFKYTMPVQAVAGR